MKDVFLRMEYKLNVEYKLNGEYKPNGEYKKATGKKDEWKLSVEDVLEKACAINGN